MLVPNIGGGGGGGEVEYDIVSFPISLRIIDFKFLFFEPKTPHNIFSEYIRFIKYKHEGCYTLTRGVRYNNSK